MSELPAFRRDDLAQFFGSNPRLLRAFEEHSDALQSITTGVAETSALKDATVVVLSANGDFTNERVLQIGDGIDVEVTDSSVTFSVKDVARTQDHGVTFVPPAEVLIFLPADGTLLSDTTIGFFFSGLGNYANDAAAAAGGVGIGYPYRNGSVFMVRIA